MQPSDVTGLTSLLSAAEPTRRRFLSVAVVAILPPGAPTFLFRQSFPDTDFI